jgi:hypothetical protein
MHISGYTVSLELGIRASPCLARALAQDAELAARRTHKPLAPPLQATVASVRALCRDVGRLGACLGLAWLLEYHPPFAHADKVWNGDVYCCWCVLLLLYALTDVRTLKPAEVRVSAFFAHARPLRTQGHANVSGQLYSRPLRQRRLKPPSETQTKTLRRLSAPSRYP